MLPRVAYTSITRTTIVELLLENPRELRKRSRHIPNVIFNPDDAYLKHKQIFNGYYFYHIIFSLIFCVELRRTIER